MKRFFLASVVLLGGLAGCANGSVDPTPGEGGAGPGSGGAGGAGGAPEAPCESGTVEACYSGPEGTQNLGSCKAGERSCVGGQWTPCYGEQTPVLELCNGKDDDCNGAADDGNPGVGNTCVTGMKGVCGQGVSECKDGALHCIPAAMPSVEICDGLDNNCDGSVDTQAVGSGQDCDTGTPGICANGKVACVGGALVCNYVYLPSLENCNGKDDDCNGVIDDLDPAVLPACDTGLPGACAKGKQGCDDGKPLCIPPSAMATEACDGVDANCDGVTDDDVCASVSLEPVADTHDYVYAPDSNSGSSASLEIEPGEGNVYLRFDLSSVPSGIQIVSVRLEMLAYSGYAYGGDGNVYTTFVPDDLWDEMALTWSNQPSAEPAQLGFWFLWYDWNDMDKVGANESSLLVPFVQEALDSDKLVSFRLYSSGYSTYYRSREWNDPAQRPKLVVRYAMP